MHPPRFWYGGEGRDAAPVLQAALQPLSWLYGAATARRIRRGTPLRCGAPVICIGNLTVGGAGKTPVARMLRRRLERLGVRAATLSRGYGGKLKGPLQVDPLIHGAADVGDEPLLHARDGLAVVARDRLAGARAAIDAGAELILMDDGFQNPALFKDLSILVFDAAAGVGNGKVFPAGPLREQLGAGLARADAAILMGSNPVRPEWLGAFEGPVLKARLEPASALPPGRYFAFAGIGRPQKFFDTLIDAGGELADGAAFPDHHLYSVAELEELAAQAAVHGARLITTEKDLVRVPLAWRDRVAVLPVEARLEDEGPLSAMLARLVEPMRRSL